MRLRDSARAAAARCSSDIVNGRYRLDGLLGAGGTADVHRGFDLSLRRPVAIKVFRPDTGFDIEESWRSEAVLLARLHHPGLVTVYDAGQYDGQVFLVMELIEGTTLKARIAQRPLSSREVSVLGAYLAHALAHAHDAQIVHRDVKPSNILLDASSRPHLTDFGISRLVDTTSRTASGTLTGTAAYLSPEQVLGQPVGRPADVYALGLVLLECLTGRLEYGGGPLEAAIARLHRPPALPDGISEPLAGLLRDMTALDEADRPTAALCAHTLAEAADRVRSPAVTPLPASRPAPGADASRPADHTHRNVVPLSSRTASGTRGRRRARIAGASIAMAAALAATLAVGDDLGSRGSDQNGNRATHVPTKETSSSAGREKATPPASTPPSGVGGTPTRFSDQEPTQGSGRPTDSETGPLSPAASSSTASGRGTASPPGNPAAAAAASHQPPGQLKKAAKAEKAPKAEKEKAAKPRKATKGR
ncbi:serine/threonine-protein kinase [Streptomyces sp. NPDC102487]|uniref:serine/threonine-protein kinase n=1 Tax=Streptomyces sp. NPDC102487 TaxID=3366182 RepID=UPI00381074A7